MPNRSEIEKNPFSIATPENLSAEEIVKLFVPYPEFENLQSSGHQFLDGHRGSGKSMMLRMMCPDCQSLELAKNIEELPYFAVYISIKKTNINNPEYQRIEHEIGGTVISEHLLTHILLSSLISNLQNYTSSYIDENNLKKNLLSFIKNNITNYFSYAGWEGKFFELDNLSANEIYSNVVNELNNIYAKTINYIKRRAFTSEPSAYTGVLFGFQDTLLPIIKAFNEAKILPSPIPIYFLLDDADNLTRQQTQILNTWVSYRSTDLVSLKISTQLNYKSFETVSGIRIQAPHDFTKIQFTSILTGSKKINYPDLIRKIVEKRLLIYGLESPNAEEYFPFDSKQAEAISIIEEEIKEKWPAEGKGYRPGDDTYRYARPEYIRRLSGTSKQGHRYSYSGFDQLVHISSGIIRFFLEPASYMFAEQLKQNSSNELVRSITPTIQDQVIRAEAKKLAFESIDEMVSDHSFDEPEKHLTNIKKLQNLVMGLGEIFKAHVLDEKASQRRLFSFTISGDSTILEPVLKLGCEYGYFYTDVRGSRDGLSVEKKYVLTRRLAPIFSLDPIGFSGDKSLKSSLLYELCQNPKILTSRLREEGASVIVKDEPVQTSLLED